MAKGPWKPSQMQTQMLQKDWQGGSRLVLAGKPRPRAGWRHGRLRWGGASNRGRAWPLGLSEDAWEAASARALLGSPLPVLPDCRYYSILRTSCGLSHLIFTTHELSTIITPTLYISNSKGKEKERNLPKVMQLEARFKQNPLCLSATTHSHPSSHME